MGYSRGERRFSILLVIPRALPDGGSFMNTYPRGFYRKCHSSARGRSEIRVSTCIATRLRRMEFWNLFRNEIASIAAYIYIGVVKLVSRVNAFRSTVSNFFCMASWQRI